MFHRPLHFRTCMSLPRKLSEDRIALTTHVCISVILFHIKGVRLEGGEYEKESEA